MPRSSPFVSAAVFEHLSTIGLSAGFHKIESHLFAAYYRIETVSVSKQIELINSGLARSIQQD